MDVLLIRHATALPAVGKMRDDDRYLAEEGRATALRVGKKLHELGVRPTVVYTSPLVRAVQTAELVSFGLGPHRVVTHVPLSIDHGSTAQALSVLDHHHDADVVLLVTHEPKVRALAASLAGRREFPGFPTAGVAAFRRHGRSTQLLYRLDPTTLTVDESMPRGD